MKAFVLAMVFGLVGCGVDISGGAGSDAGVTQVDAGADATCRSEPLDRSGRAPIAWQCWSAGSVDPAPLTGANMLVVDAFDNVFTFEGDTCPFCPVKGTLRVVANRCAEMHFPVQLGGTSVLDAQVCNTPAGWVGYIETGGYRVTFYERTPADTCDI